MSANPDTVITSNKRSRGGQAVSINSVGDTNYTVWFAPMGMNQYSTWMTGTTMTSTGGFDTTINAPGDEGTYYIYLRNNNDGTLATSPTTGSAASTNYLTVDNTAPTTQNLVLSSSVEKRSYDYVTIAGSDSGSQDNEIWLAPDGLTNVDSFDVGTPYVSSGSSDRAGATQSLAEKGAFWPTWIRAPNTEGDYKLYVIDDVGNVSQPSTATVTVDNTVTNTLSNSIFPTSTTKTGGAIVTINSSGDIGNEVVFAPAGANVMDFTFVGETGATMTKAFNGTSTTINAPLNDGTYYIYVYDGGAYFVSSASTASLTVSNVVPDPPGVSFPVGTTNSNTVTVTLSTGADSYSYSTNYGATFTNGTGTSFPLPDATYAIDQIQVKNSDSNGAESQATTNSAIITIDTVAPSAPSVTFPSGTTNNNSVSVTLATGATSYQFSTNSGGNFSVGTLAVNVMGGTTDTGSFQLSDDTYAIDQIQVKNTDAAGNVSSTTNNSSQITIDTVVPAPPLVTFPSQGLGNNNTVLVTLSSGATSYKYSIDSGVSFTTGTGTSFQLSDATYNIDEIRVKNGDDAGNESTTINNSYQIIINTNIPDAPSVTFPTGTTNNRIVLVTLATNAVSYEFSIDSGAIFTSGTGTSFTLSEGTYTVDINQIQVRNTDSAGNTSATTNNSAQFTIDTDAPSSPSVSFPSGNTNNNVVTVTLATGATSYEYSIDSGINFSAGTGTSFTLSDGTYVTHQIHVKNSDAAGNTSSETKNILPIVLDTVPPSAPTVSFPVGTTQNNTVTVTLASNAISYEFSIDSGVSFTNGTGTSFTLNDATYSINQVQVRNTDSFGNTSTSTTNTNGFTVDTNVPDAPTIVFPIGVTNNNIITIVLSDTSVSWEYSIDSGVNFVTGIGGTIILSNGTYIVNQVQIRTLDSAVNPSAITSNTSQFIVDTSLSDTTTTSDSTATTSVESCVNQRKQRSQFFFHEAGSNVRFEDVSPYIKDQSGNLIYTPQQLDMRRKAEILKYKTPNTGNIQKNKYSQLSRSTKRNNTACANTNLLIPTSSSNVPGKVMNLTEDPNIPLYKYYSQQEQFRFQNLAYDNFKRIFDIFPINNIIVDVENNEPAGDIILLNPNTPQLTFDFTFPICINYNANYTLPSSTTYPEGNSAITAFNISIFSAELQIFYSDTLIQTKILPFSSITPTDTDLSKTTFTCSTIFDEPGSTSTNGPVNLQTYMGILQFKNITLASVTQYVYSLKINVKLNYSEFDSQPGAAARSNVNGNNVSSIGERNLTNVSYNSVINIENSSVTAFNANTNCNFELFNNPPEGEDATNLVEITNPTFVPFSISTV